MNLRQFTSESVTEGHPDKICDRISDAVVDAYLHADDQARCGVETMVMPRPLRTTGSSLQPE